MPPVIRLSSCKVIYKIVLSTKAETTPATKLALIRDFDKVLDIGLIDAAKKIIDNETEPSEGADGEFVAYIEDMIAQRVAAKKEKNFARADEIRAELLEKGVVLIDTREGTKYEIKG